MLYKYTYLLKKNTEIVKTLGDAGMKVSMIWLRPPQEKMAGVLPTAIRSKIVKSPSSPG
jgi:hypothetical protein